MAPFSFQYICVLILVHVNKYNIFCFCIFAFSSWSTKITLPENPCDKQIKKNILEKKIVLHHILIVDFP